MRASRHVAMAARTGGGVCEAGGGVCEAGGGGGEQRGLLCRLTERARRLEGRLAELWAAAADRDTLRDEAGANLEWLDALGRRQAAAFGGLIDDYRATCGRREAAAGGLAAERRARGRSERERKRVLRATAALRAAADRAAAAARLLVDEIRTNRARLEDADRAARGREELLRRTERRLEEAADRLEAAEARDADARAACSALRDRAVAERARAQCLASAVADLRAGHDAAVRSARAELERARDRLAAGVAERARADSRLCEARGERDAVAASADREARRLRDKGDAVGWLAAPGSGRDGRAVVEWLAARAATAHARLGEVRAENGRLERRYDGLAAAVRDGAAAEERLRREVRRAGRAAELAEQQLKARRRRRTNEAKLYGRRLTLGRYRGRREPPARRPGRQSATAVDADADASSCGRH